MQNEVSGTLTSEQHQTILTALTTIRENIPYLVSLSKADRGRLVKMGDRSEAFVRKAVDVCKENDAFLPRGLEVDEFERDYNLYTNLQTIRLAMDSLYAELSDTLFAAGSDAYKTALEVYAYAKASSIDEVEELKALLGERFSSQGKRGNNPDETVSMEA